MNTASPVKTPVKEEITEAKRGPKVKEESVAFVVAKPECKKANLTKSQSIKTRSFRCFKEDQVLKFVNFKPVKLEYKLLKGDDDEASDDEDISNGTKFMQLHVEKALAAALKTSTY